MQPISEEFDIGGSDAVRIIGILGMVGTGKTTIAQAIVGRFHQNCDGGCFLSEVREGDMVKLQNKLLRDILKSAKVKVSTVYQGIKEIERRLGSKKVLVVVDDVDCVKQLQELAIKHDAFGPGSRIIVTARDERLLKMLKVDNICKTQLTNKEEASFVAMPLLRVVLLIRNFFMNSLAHLLITAEVCHQHLRFYVLLYLQNSKVNGKVPA